VFRHACKFGLEASCRSERIHPSVPAVRPIGSKKKTWHASCSRGSRRKRSGACRSVRDLLQKQGRPTDLSSAAGERRFQENSLRGRADRKGARWRAERHPALNHAPNQPDKKPHHARLTAATTNRVTAVNKRASFGCLFAHCDGGRSSLIAAPSKILRGIRDHARAGAR
jgi:hypothetical protein